MIVWQDQGHRILALCGSVDVGAVFLPVSGKGFRYRVWVGFPLDGVAKSEEAGKRAVTDHFSAFLAAASLQPVPEGGAA
ncbi:hypothetical protein G6L41_008770 [Agrobacterium tumefaciens]|uniref:hypothetical protein n=1 Tax=Agrobacterium tumefaciens TaxID=358 RepID=UPI001571847D|nr:hypothetical protein [Agrobacterium tumefaciens]WCK12362.1 hypothetical protein G6L41_008770 [Agrobacterium tumefaciens]